MPKLTKNLTDIVYTVNNEIVLAYCVLLLIGMNTHRPQQQQQKSTDLSQLNRYCVVSFD
jgi:hypothetical protein